MRLLFPIANAQGILIVSNHQLNAKKMPKGMQIADYYGHKEQP